MHKPLRQTCKTQHTRTALHSQVAMLSAGTHTDMLRRHANIHAPMQELGIATLSPAQRARSLGRAYSPARSAVKMQRQPRQSSQALLGRLSNQDCLPAFQGSSGRILASPFLWDAINPASVCLHTTRRAPMAAIKGNLVLAPAGVGRPLQCWLGVPADVLHASASPFSRISS